MPVVSRFYGIVIKMYFNDHLPAHFHVIYGEYVGLYRLDDIAVIEGDLPAKAHQLVVEWALAHQNELTQMWQSKEFHIIEGLK